MARNIFEVNARVVDANGTYSVLDGYPKTFDSKNYNGDTEKALQRAYGAYHECLGAMCKVDTRQIQLVTITSVASGVQLEVTKMGNFKENADEDMPE